MFDLLFTSPIGQWILLLGALVTIALAAIRSSRAAPTMRLTTFLQTLIIGFPLTIGIGIFMLILLFIGVGILNGGDYL
ncbi:MAG: hypothetical protein L3J30_05790 [Marinosulfonomonas sp.]|nr:hypothetical protein [Marinosulfonomonas sp.]